MSSPRRIGLRALAAMLVTVAATGCGVSTSAPVDLGDRRVAGVLNGSTGNVPPTPNEARTPVELVESFLKAGVESSQGPSLQRIRSFFTSRYNAQFQVDSNPRPFPTVIRVIGTPSAGSNPDGRTVTVHYVVIGVLNPQGRVDDLADPAEKVMSFQVTQADDNPLKIRIDGISDPASNIMISDEALYEFYQIEPVYFWDATNTRLIPDIRYIPNGLADDVRAGRIAQMLADGPSSWLAGAQRLPTGTAVKGAVQIHDGTAVVNLTINAAAGGDAGIARLYHQLQWSLAGDAAAPAVSLEIEDKPQTFKGGASDYLVLDESYSVPPRGVKYDIVDGKVVPLVAPPKPLNVLAAKENAGVVSAAINRTGSLAAYVKTTQDNRRTLQIVRDGANTVTVDFGSRSGTAGRPVWVTNDHLLIPYGGRLYSVSSGDSHAVDVTPSRVGQVRAVSVSPDARRIALVGDSQVYVTSVNVTSVNAGDNQPLTVGPNPRLILSGQVAAAAVAWASEGWLYVAGTGAMWQVTPDGVIARDQSRPLGGVNPTDVVAFPAPFSYESAEVDLYAGAAIYPFVSQLSQLTQDVRLKAPFFGG